MCVNIMVVLLVIFLNSYSQPYLLQPSPDKEPLDELHRDVASIVNKCNEGVRQAETRRHMADLEKK